MLNKRDRHRKKDTWTTHQRRPPTGNKISSLPVVCAAFNSIILATPALPALRLPKKTDPAPVSYPFFDRDLSWLSFNERVLMEAQRDSVPLMERIRFLAIYSSNLDEFYRVRMPARTA